MGQPTKRQLLRAGLVIGGLAFAISLLAPQASEVPTGLAALPGAHPGWLGVAMLTTAGAYMAAALALQGAVPERLHFGRTVQVQVATSFAAVVAPAGLAGMALNVRFLERSGMDRAQAVTAVGLGRFAAFTVHATTLVALSPFLVHHLDGAGVPSGRTPMLLAGGLAAAAAVVLAHQARRRRLTQAFAALRVRLAAVLRHRRKVAALLGGSLLTTAARALTLAAALRALGVPAPLLAVIALYLAAEAIGAIGSTPGGLGLLDGALLTGLGALGVAASSAIASILVFRLLTFWLPTAPGAINLKLLRRAGLV